MTWTNAPRIEVPKDLSSRREVLRAAAAGALGAFALPAWAAGPRALPLIEVWKSPTCGCCGDWAKRMQAAGFKVKINEVPNPPMRAKLGVDLRYGSCHTALVGGYAVEGHVPAREIVRLLQERPNAIGIAVPGMPIGSPGMDDAVYEGRKDPYDVLLLARDGSASVYHAYR
jgi:hypothetical protein